MDVGGPLLDRVRESTEWTSLIAGALVVGSRRGRPCPRPRPRRAASPRRRVELDVSVELADRALQVVLVGDGELDVHAERQPQVVRGERRRSGRRRRRGRCPRPRADRHGAVAAREALGQQARGSRLDLRVVQVDELEALLLGERLREVARRSPSRARRRSRRAACRSPLLGERLLELLRGQQTLAHEQRAEPQPGELCRFHRDLYRQNRAKVEGGGATGRGSARAWSTRASSARSVRGCSCCSGWRAGTTLPAASRLAGEGGAAARLRGRRGPLRPFARGRRAAAALVVSQFTLLGDTRRGRGTRPDFSQRRHATRRSPSTKRSSTLCARRASRSRPASSARGCGSSSSTTGRSRSSSRCSRTGGDA